MSRPWMLDSADEIKLNCCHIRPLEKMDEEKRVLSESCLEPVGVASPRL